MSLHDAIHWHEQAVRLRREGGLAEARAAAERAVEVDPELAPAWFNLGAVLVEQGDADRGVEAYRRALALKPDYAEAWSNLGEALGARGERAQEIEAYHRAIAANPGLAPVWSNLGNALRDAGELEEAIGACRRAIELDPDFAAAWNNLGSALVEHGEHDEGARACERALQLRPELAEAWSNLGGALVLRGDIEKSLEAHHRALMLEPGNPRLHYNLGITYERGDRPEDALGCYRRALDIDAAFKPAWLKLAYLQLARGNFQEGWLEYEWRWHDTSAAPKRYDFAAWNGDRSRGGRLLLWGEQGLGDRIMYSSMIGELVEAGLKVTFESEPRLVTLMRRSFSGLRVVERSAVPALDPAEFDYQAPLASLGRWLRPTFESFPRHSGYLKPDKEKVGAFRRRLRDAAGAKRVGISWSSANQEIGAYKSTTLLQWERPLVTPGIRFLDLQYGDTREAREQLRRQVGVDITHLDDVDLRDDLEAFAALCAACDLVITVSNVTAHMAGALGTPVWLLAPRWRGRHWYWFFDRSDSPWYPSMRIFTQHAPGDWGAMLDEVARELAGFVGGAR